MTFEAALRVADAVLYEGYLLYPYRASSDKNRVRFQFGVVVPRDHCVTDPSETWEMQTECLVEAGRDARIDVRVRFLQLQARIVEQVDPEAPGGFSPVASLVVGGEELLTWEEAVEGEVDAADLSLDELRRSEHTLPLAISGGQAIELIEGPDGTPVGRMIRTRWPIDGLLRIAAERAGAHVKLRVRVENHTAFPVGELTRRDEALRTSLLGCHTLLAVRGGAFVSLIDPPAAAAEASKGCTNLKTWPVLIGDEGRHDLILSSPIILYDHPAIAPESQGPLFDSTEIDEILTLRIMTLSDDEKRAARATDPRARAIIDAADGMPPEMLDRLHGAMRYFRETTGLETPEAREPEVAPLGIDPDPLAAIQPWSPDLDEPAWPTFTSASLGLRDDGPSDLPPSVWAPDARVPPERAAIVIDGITISKGASVRLRPTRRGDSMDLFLAGMVATVERVYESVDDDMHIAVTLDDDPANDLQRATGRYYYFAPDELEPLHSAPIGAGDPPILLEPALRSEARR